MNRRESIAADGRCTRVAVDIFANDLVKLSVGRAVDVKRAAFAKMDTLIADQLGSTLVE